MNFKPENLDKSALSPRGGGYLPASRALLAAILLGAAPAVAADLSTPTLGNDSAYTLTKVDAAGENTITKFEYNSTTGEFSPVYYRVDLKQTEYGSGTQSIQVQVNTPTAPGTITFKYNNPDTTSPVDGNYVNKYLLQQRHDS